MEDWSDLSSIDIETLIPIVGRHIQSWENVRDIRDAEIRRLSGHKNITCLIKARDKSIQQRYIVF